MTYEDEEFSRIEMESRIRKEGVRAIKTPEPGWIWLTDAERDHIIEHYRSDLGALVNRVQMRAKELNT